MTLYAIKYLWSGDLISGSTAREVVQKMKDKSPFTRNQSIKQYMKGYARRHRVFPGGARISYRSTDRFLRSLAYSVLVEYIILDGTKIERG